ncbi:MAG TPA: 1-(5-phosphoribosyl)-5-[(5-phosphoribosylamino)methylideneamino]imidazole-4-carboxamide isomerase, partial [Saprospiraceae bacterium]|nr:1-(5-phosphoribosyl)-5-[(5-phosphoribosylamino)methylideneamino]imidazole-4-carboxamide isomerase [Saprospiraceae bacterium]
MIQILPAIDMINGRCVRLTKGDYDTEKVYHEDPVEMAQSFERAGAKYIHLVDLDAAKKQGNNYDVISKIASSTNLVVQMGGGIRDTDTLQQVFDFGVSRAIIGSLAVKDPETVFDWVQKFGPEKIVIGTDVMNGFIATDGWYVTSDQDINSFVSAYMIHGATTFLCTDISRDGMLQGIATDLYQDLQNTHKGIQLIASGGVKDMTDVVAAKDLDMYGIVIGKAIYEGNI